MKTTIIIKDVKQIKEGYGKSGKWVLYKVIDSNDVQYTTFRDYWLTKIGQTMEVEYLEQKNGKFVNRTIVESKNTQEVKIETRDNKIEEANKFYEKLNSIENKLDKIITFFLSEK